MKIGPAVWRAGRVIEKPNTTGRQGSEKVTKMLYFTYFGRDSNGTDFNQNLHWLTSRHNHKCKGSKFELKFWRTAIIPGSNFHFPIDILHGPYNTAVLTLPVIQPWLEVGKMTAWNSLPFPYTLTHSPSTRSLPSFPFRFAFLLRPSSVCPCPVPEALPKSSWEILGVLYCIVLFRCCGGADMSTVAVGSKGARGDSWRVATPRPTVRPWTQTPTRLNSTDQLSDHSGSGDVVTLKAQFDSTK